jgi:leader peptidase (prepilin peptidase)/N-methyltransferase
MAVAVELINGWVADGQVWPVLAAPFIGSFCGVWIARLPAGRGVVWGRSACPACGHALGVADLLPVLSFCALRGRCRYCAAPIPRMHLWVELAATGLALWAAATGIDGAVLWASCVLGWALLTLGWIDATCLRLPDALTLPLILAGLAEAAWLEPDALTGRAFGAAVGYTLLWGLALAYRKWRGRDGMGLGDAKLLAAAGAWVGVALLPQVLLGAALAGLAWALRHGRVNAREKIPFGVFLAAAAWVVWLYG